MKKLVGAIISVLAILLLGGCARENRNDNITPVALSVVLSNNQGFPALSEVSVNRLYDEICDVCVTGVSHEGASVSIVINDGNPYPCYNKFVDCIETNVTPSKRIAKAESMAKEIIHIGVKNHAKTPEVNTLESINIAVDTVNSSEAEEKKIVMYANGLQTAGILNMLEVDLISADIQIVVKQLHEKHAINDLTGIKFTWVGLGEVPSDTHQKEIPNSAKHKLQVLWKTIIESAGGEVIFVSDVVCGESLPDLPDVSEVVFVQDTLDKMGMEEVIKFDESTSVKFKGNQAVFVDEKAAIEKLNPVIEFLKQNPTEIYYVVGMTATVGDLSESIKLSKHRAEVVCQKIVQSGVNTTQVIPLGLGHRQNRLRVPDLDSSGTLIESMAKKNRAVFFVNSRSQLAVELLNN